MTDTTPNKPELIERAALTTAEATLNGKPITLEALDLLDIILLKKKIGGLWLLDPTDPEHQLYLYWLALRRVDSHLSPEQKAKREYLMTEEEAGAQITAPFLISAEGTEFFRTVLRLAGFDLLDPETEPEEAETETEGNAPAPETAPTPAKKLSRKPSEKTATG